MIKSTSRRLIASAVLFASAASVATAATAHRLFADISGVWAVTAASPQGASESTATFKQEGTALSGTLAIPELGNAKLTGTVKGDTVAFGFTLDVQGNQIPVTVNGMVKDKGQHGRHDHVAGGHGQLPVHRETQAVSAAVQNETTATLSAASSRAGSGQLAARYCFSTTRPFVACRIS
jgi:hypothetical protein